MAATSAEAGFLAALTDPAYGDALDDQLHPWVVGITGLPATSVRPSAQVEPANIPDRSTDWCAFWVADLSPDTFATDLEDPLDPDAQIQHTNETFRLRLSFYGPNASRYAARVGAALQISQNRDSLRPFGITILGAEPIARVPELVKDQWYQRADLPLNLRRVIIRRYAVLELLATSGELNNERYTTQIEVTEP